MEKFKLAFSKLVILGCSVAGLVSCASAAIDKTSSSPLSIELPAEPVIEGGVFYVSLKSKLALDEVIANFQGHVVKFYPDIPGELNERKLADTDSHEAGEHRYKALVGAAYGAQTGENPFVVRARSSGEVFEVKSMVSVKDGVFPSETLRVPPRTITPTARDKKQIARDRAVLKRTYSSQSEVRYWDPPAVMPVESDVTSVFGTSRVYNGKKQNVHLGTDLRARVGTPLYVPLSGKVALARKLFYTGNTVILDHGFGLFTIYGHLSKLKLREGQIAKKGIVMGLAGATGRASGPHLHWGVQLHGAKVDPLILVKALK